MTKESISKIEGLVTQAQDALTIARWNDPQGEMGFVVEDLLRAALHELVRIADRVDKKEAA